MNADGNSFRFVTFQGNVVVDEVFREDSAFRQELIVRFERVKRFVERTRYAADFAFLCIGQLVDVLVERAVTEGARIDFLLDAVQTCKQHGCECEVRVSRAVRCTELDTTAFRRYSGHRNTNGCRTVAFGEHEVNRRFVTRNQTFERVRARVRQCDQSRCMVQDTADVVQSELAQVTVTVLVIEQRLVAVKDRLVNVHPATVIAEQRFRHERSHFAVLASCVLHDIFVFHQVIGCFRQRIETEVDLALTRSRHFMVMTLDAKTGFDQQTAHFGTDVLLGIRRSNRHVSAFMAYFKAEIAAFFFTVRVPVSFFGIYEVGRRVLFALETNFVEDEKFGFRSKECCRTYAGFFSNILQPSERCCADRAHNARHQAYGCYT